MIVISNSTGLATEMFQSLAGFLARCDFRDFRFK